MICYHGTPLGGKITERQRFYVGRHSLIPFPRQDDMEIVAEVCSSFIFDNGAFTIWKQGGKLDINGYYKFCDHWHRHPGFDWAVIPDVICGSEKDNDELIKNWPKHIKGVPVYHMHESIERAERLSEEWEIVALGSSGKWSTPGSKKWFERMSLIMEVMTDSEGRAKCKLHGLRMLNPKVFTRLPLHSADSTNAAINAGCISRFGMYKPPRRDQRADIIASRIEQYNSSPTWNKIKGGLLYR